MKRALLYVLLISLAFSACSTPTFRNQHDELSMSKVDLPVITTEIFMADFPRGRIEYINNFDLPQLNTKRTIRVYLPPDYDQGNKSYPVAYLQDGQNLYLSATSAKGGWLVDHSLDALQSAGLIEGMIVVGIDNSANRHGEYGPFEFSYGSLVNDQPVSEDYAEFIVETLKPYIDENFRTSIEKEHTMIGGSSLGSLISVFTALRYPEVFGMVAAFSSSWIAEEPAGKMMAYAREHMPQSTARWFFYVAEQEPQTMSQDLFDLSQDLGLESVHYIDPRGGHDEPSWAAGFRAAVPWLLGKSHRSEAVWQGISRNAPYSPWAQAAVAEVMNLSKEQGEQQYPAGQVVFKYVGDANSVVLAGEFTGWDPSSSDFAMTEVEESVWQITVDLAPGSYEYKYVVDGVWVQASDSYEIMFPPPTTLARDPFGGYNAVIVLE